MKIIREKILGVLVNVFLISVVLTYEVNVFVAFICGITCISVTLFAYYLIKKSPKWLKVIILILAVITICSVIIYINRDILSVLRILILFFTILCLNELCRKRNTK